MSVLARNRNTAPLEYEHTFELLWKDILSRTTKVSKRKRKWICIPLEHKLIEIYDNITQLTEKTYFQKIKVTNFSEEIENIIHQIEALQYDFYIYWSIEKVHPNVQTIWVDLANKDLVLLANLLSEEINYTQLEIVQWDDIMEAQFMSNMQRLMQIVHAKVINAPQNYNQSMSLWFVKLIDDACYELWLANKNKPKTKEDYKARQRHFAKALEKLKQAERPLTQFMIMFEYTDGTMRYWNETFCKEINLIEAVRKSDKERLKRLSQFHFE